MRFMPDPMAYRIFKVGMLSGILTAAVYVASLAFSDSSLYVLLLKTEIESVGVGATMAFIGASIYVQRRMEKIMGQTSHARA